VSANLSYDLACALSVKHQATVLSPKPTRPMGYDFSSPADSKYPFRHNILNSFTHPKSAFVGRFRESYSFGKACAKFINKHHKEIDVIYMNTWPLFGQYLAVKAANKFNIPSIVHVQDIYPEALTQKLPSLLKGLANLILFPIERFINVHSASIVTISQGMKSLICATRNIPPSKVEVVFNWQDETKFLAEVHDISNKSSDTFTHFMFLGSLGPVANIDNLILALTQLKGNDIQLTISGEGSEKTKLQSLVKDLKETRVKFIQAPASEAGKIQATADVLLLSLKKGAAGLALPSKLPAYMFSAKPIIATVDHDSDTANAIRDAGCGWVIEPENPAALTAMMQTVHAVPKNELNAIGLKGRSYALKHFSKHANLSKLVSIIEEVIKK
jgi:glycosyltransferase involved in cell wall biosynthesis